MQIPRQNQVQTLTIYLTFTLLTVALLALHSYQFWWRDYRQDEVIGVHLALEHDLAGMVREQAEDIHVPAWYITLDLWVSAFGHMERLTRILSTLYAALALALIYRLGADLFDARVGLLAALLLGSAAFYQLFAHEVRPYALLVPAVIAAGLTFLRWWRRPRFMSALLYVAAGVLAVYTHYFAVYVIVAQAVFALLFVERRLLARAFALFALVALALTGWLLPLLHSLLVNRGGGIEYAVATDPASLAALYDLMQFTPRPLAEVLLIAALLLPVSVVLRGRNRDGIVIDWRKAYLIVIPLVTLVLAFALNVLVSSVTPRNLIVILPSLALLMAFALRAAPWQVQTAAVVIVAAYATAPLAPIHSTKFSAMADWLGERYQPGSPVLLDVDSISAQVTMDYYVRERAADIPKDDLFHLLNPDIRRVLSIMPAAPVHQAWSADESALARFDAFTDNAERVYYVAGEDGTSFGTRFVEQIESAYIPLDSSEYPGGYRLVEYRRIPNDLETVLVFGDAIELRGWDYAGDVNVQQCQRVALSSWWRLHGAPPNANYSLTLVLADATGQGRAQSDGSPSPTLTGLWQQDALYYDERTLTVPCDLAPGEYPLLVGMYDPDNAAEPLPITSADGSPVGSLAYLTTLWVGGE